MRTFHKIFLLLSIAFMTGCATGRSKPSDFPEHSYDEIELLKIDYNKSLAQEDTDYLVYFYLESCRECSLLKNEIIDFALSDYFPIYFIEVNSTLIHTYQYNEIDKTIGATNYKDVWVGLTPQLATISYGAVVDNKLGLVDIEYVLSTYKNNRE